MGWIRLVWVLLGILWWIGRSKRVGRPAPRRPYVSEEPQGDQPVSDGPYGVRSDPTDPEPGSRPQPDPSIPPEETVPGTGPHLEPSTAEGWPQQWEDDAEPASDSQTASDPTGSDGSEDDSSPDSAGTADSPDSADSPSSPDSAGTAGSADSPDSPGSADSPAVSPSSAG